MALKDDGTMVRVTRLVEPVDDGRHTQVSYYCGERKVAQELYDTDGNVIQTSGVIPDGTVKEYYPDGILKEASLFQDGRANGRSMAYYPDGKIFENSNYRNGLLHGWSRTYRRDGTLWIQLNFHEGRLHGGLTSYHNNGLAEIRAEYWNGELNGHFVIYDKAGNLRKEGMFNMGKANGEHLSYYPTGGLARCETYRDGKLVSCEEFMEDGTLIASSNNNSYDDRRCPHGEEQDLHNSA